MLQIQTYPVDLMQNNYRVAGGKLTKVGVFFADIACSPVTNQSTPGQGRNSLLPGLPGLYRPSPPLFSALRLRVRKTCKSPE